MGEFTSLGNVRLAISNVSVSVNLTQIAGFQVVDKSGNAPADSATRRRPFVLRMTYLPTAGAGVVFFRTGVGAQVAVATDAPILSNWPLQRLLREFEDTIAAIAAGAGDSGTLCIEFGYGEPV